MKKTFLPKIFALLLCLLCWIVWPVYPALLADFVILTVSFIALTIPVLHPRSNFYIPTFSSGQNASGRVALTFDDGPDPRYTPQILDYLDREGIRAAFFVVGSRVAQYPDLVREIVARGHVVGNHSYHHGFNFHFSLRKAFHRDLDAFDLVMHKAIGRHCRLFRAPQGIRTPLLADVLRDRKLDCIGWQARGFDSVRKSSDRILQSIIHDLASGSIVLLHDGGGLGGSEERAATLKTLPLLIEAIRARGLAFERLDKLLGVEAYSS
ncbi:MAG: polysaccharide deacetylase family protein [Oligoflexus sp.]|nr:polysaccharide deacetylase family protein [Oligoflexus sp.]